MRQKATYAVDDLATMRITLIDYVAVHWPADDPTRLVRGTAVMRAE